MSRKILLAMVALWLGAALGCSSHPSIAAEGEPPADRGKTLYEQKCAVCHGKDGQAKAMAKNSGSFNDPEWQKTASLEGIVKVTLEGRGKMPKYEGKLTREEIDAIGNYIRKLK